MASFNAAQSESLFTVILMVSATPVRSDRISPFTKDEGVLVGKGPAVSVGDTEQEPLPVLPPVSVVVMESFLHACASGTMAEAPKAAINPFFRNFFLSMLVGFGYGYGIAIDGWANGTREQVSCELFNTNPNEYFSMFIRKKAVELISLPPR